MNDEIIATVTAEYLNYYDVHLARGFRSGSDSVVIHYNNNKNYNYY